MSIRKTAILFAAAALTGACGVRAALVIDATFNPAGGGWTTDQTARATQAINDWTGALSLATTGTVSITFFLDNSLGSELGICETSYVRMDDVVYTPWNPAISNSIYINATNVSFSAALPEASQYDGLSLFRHEIAHALGFQSGFRDTTGGADIDLWLTKISGTSFDAGSTTIPMASLADLDHVAAPEDLMYAALTAGTRYSISSNDVAMLSAAYGYTAVPEPATALLLLGGGTLTILRRPVRRRR